VPQAPYNETAVADARVRAAAARAKKANKLLLVDFGGNWCPDCRVLAGLVEEPAAKAFLAKHYEIVLVDVGRMDKNLQIPARYGIAKVRAVPAVVIVTPKGKILNPGDEFALSDAGSMNPQVVMNKLAAWVP
jgi:thiol-disulfide isomerase/thioredoxin